MQATLIARRTKCTRDVEQLAADKATLQGQIDHLHQAWNRGWQAIGVTPLAPRDMRAWVDKHEQLRRRAESMREYHRQFNRLHERIEEHRSELYQSLARLSDEAVPAHATLDALLAHSEALIETIEEVGRQRHDLQTQVSRLQQELQGAQHEQRKATDQLDQAIGGERTILGQMDESARAAEAAEKGQAILAGRDVRSARRRLR
jgi:chromosome segregation ATPase